MVKTRGWESNCQFDSRPLKVRNCPDFLVCRWRATYRWKALNEGYNFTWNLISIRGLQTKLWAPKSREFQLWEFWDLGVPGQNATWMLVPWPGTKYTIRGKVVASPKFGSWWVLWIRVCPWLVLAPKVFQLCTNQLLFGLCRSVWMIDYLSFFLISSWCSNTPFYPQSVAN
jgi:hypothetical protein